MRATLKFLALSAAVIGWLSVGSHRADADVTITLANASGSPGDTLPITATLASGTDMVAGTQNDITIPDGLSIGVDQDGNPNCTVNSAIHKSGTAFAYLPAGCTVGTDCTGVRAIVLSLTNVTVIPDGSVLYTCQVTVAESATAGEYTLNNSNASASTPTGGQLPATGVAGVVTVGGGSADATIVLGDGNGDAGGTATFTATLMTGVMVAGTQNDIAFDSHTKIPPDQDGNPSCTVNPAIHKTGTAFAYLPAGCTVGTDCTGVRAIVLSLTNVTPIPDGSVLYTCTVSISEDAAGTYPLVCSGPSASDPQGGQLTANCTNGHIIVGGGATLAQAITATDTSIPLSDASGFPNSGTIMIDNEQITYTGKDGNTLTGATRGANGTTAAAHAAGAAVTQVTIGPTSTATIGQGTPTSTVAATRTSTSVVTPGTPTATRTGGATNTPTVAKTNTVGPTSSVPTPRILDDDGCAVTSSTNASSGWLLLLPAAMLLWVRRRTR